MTRFDKQKLTEVVLYILNKTKGLDYYHVFKIIYFANIAHLAKYGFPMVSDEFCALPDGPVPSVLYNCIKDNAYCDQDLKKMLERRCPKVRMTLIICWKQSAKPTLITFQKQTLKP